MSFLTLSFLLSFLFITATRCDLPVPDLKLYVSSTEGVHSSNCGGSFFFFTTTCANLGLAFQSAIQFNFSRTYIYVSSGTYVLNITSTLLNQLEEFTQYSDLSVIGTADIPLSRGDVSLFDLNGISFDDTTIDFYCLNFYQCGTVTPQIMSCHQDCPPNYININFTTTFVSVPFGNGTTNRLEFSAVSTTVTDCFYRHYTVDSVILCVVSSEFTNGTSLPMPVLVISSYGGSCGTLSLSDGLNIGNVYFQIPESIPSQTVIILNISIATIGTFPTYHTITLLPCFDGLFVSNGDNGRAICSTTNVNGIITCSDAYDSGSNFYLLIVGNCINPGEGIQPCPFQYSNNFKEYNLKELLSNTTNYCAENRMGKLCGSCSDGFGVPINILNKCVRCEDYPLGLFVFVLIELLPITVMVCLIIVFNIQLTNGSINGLILYSQIVTTVYPGLVLNVIIMYQGYTAPCQYSAATGSFLSYHYNHWLLYLLPFWIFNLDFTPALGNYPICITPTMGPFGAISFWYVIALYPLFLLLLLYGWLMLYNKGFKCVVLVTRPLHRCLARFWSLTKIRPSLANSIASVYLLCFTQLVTISVKLLQSTRDNDFFYDASLKFFHGAQGFVAFLAILILIFLVFLPYFYIQLYPFKPFHKLLNRVRLNKALLTSLGDIFTGPFKNGSDNVFDYRYYAGFFFLIRILIVLIHLIPFVLSYVTVYVQLPLFILFGSSVMILRPYKKVIHNFSEFLLFAILAAANSATAIFTSVNPQNVVSNISLYILLATNIIIGLIFIIYVIVKIIQSLRKCHQSRKKRQEIINATKAEAAAVNDYGSGINSDELSPVAKFVRFEENWIPDRMENPHNYNAEQHVQVTEEDARLMEEKVESIKLI